MKVTLVSIGSTRGLAKSSAEALLLEEYRSRAAQYGGCVTRSFATEDAMLAGADRERVRRPVRLVLLDSRGEMLRSEDVADRLGRFRDGGVQEVWIGVGPADGWTTATLARADLRLSLGRITLPHRLALVVAAEQVYRALTILAGHPYHGGH